MSVTKDITYTIIINSASTGPNLNDQYNRLQHFMCCIASKGSSLAYKLRLGTECCEEKRELNLLLMYWDTLACYDPISATNCLTQVQIDAIWNDISRICGICFAPYNSTYTNSLLNGCGNRVTEGSFMRITEDGNQRVVGCNQPVPNSNLDGVDYMYVDDSNIPHFIVG